MGLGHWATLPPRNEKLEIVHSVGVQQVDYRATQRGLGREERDQVNHTSAATLSTSVGGMRGRGGRCRSHAHTTMCTYARTQYTKAGNAITRTHRHLRETTPALKLDKNRTLKKHAYMRTRNRQSQLQLQHCHGTNSRTGSSLAASLHRVLTRLAVGCMHCGLAARLRRTRSSSDIRAPRRRL